MRKFIYIALCSLGASITSQAVVVVMTPNAVINNSEDFSIDFDGDGQVDVTIQNFADTGDIYRYVAAVTPDLSAGTGTQSEISATAVTSNQAPDGLDPFGIFFGGQIQSTNGFSDSASALGVTTGFTDATTYLAGSFVFGNEIADSNWVNSAAVNPPNNSIVNAVLAVRFESSEPTGSPVIYNGFVDVSFNNRTFNNQVVTINSFGFENQIPEPSSVLLFSLATLGLLRRNR